ncbi:MAG: hypothetical protein D5S00_11255 [Tindallia sp. MSAO_Bac2]|nr:MAG: hypothetical protein D5S00_11255 [Tindallia sp. MSAO_Bac2]
MTGPTKTRSGSFFFVMTSLAKDDDICYNKTKPLQRTASGKGIQVGRKTKLTERQQALIRYHQRGKRTHILFNGILSWGLLTGFLFLTIQSLWNDGFSFSAWRNTVFSGSGMITVLTFMAVGSLWGLWTWRQIEKNVAEIDEKRRKGKPKNQMC